MGREELAIALPAKAGSGLSGTLLLSAVLEGAGRLLDERLATKADIAPLATNTGLDAAKLELHYKIEASKLDLQRQIERPKPTF